MLGILKDAKLEKSVLIFLCESKLLFFAFPGCDPHNYHLNESEFYMKNPHVYMYIIDVEEDHFYEEMRKYLIGRNRDRAFKCELYYLSFTFT